MLRTATLEEIKKGKVTDVYFERTKTILESKGIHKIVVAEFALLLCLLLVIILILVFTKRQYSV